METKEKLILVKYTPETSMIYEKLTGEHLELFSPCIKKVYRRKDGTFKIESIIYYGGNTKSLEEYNDSLKKKRGHLALFINDEMTENFLDSDVETFIPEEKVSLYRRIRKLGGQVDLLDYELGMKIGLNPNDLATVCKWQNKLYTIKSYEGSINGLEKANRQLKRLNYSSGVYYVVSSKEINPEFRKYIVHFSKMGEEYTIVEELLHILPGINPETLSDHKRAYLEIIQESIPIVLRITNNNEYLIHSYNPFMNKMAGVQKISLGYVISPLMIELINLNGKFECIRDYIIELEKSPSGYKPSKMDKPKKMDL